MYVYLKTYVGNHMWRWTTTAPRKLRFTRYEALFCCAFFLKYAYYFKMKIKITKIKKDVHDFKAYV